MSNAAGRMPRPYLLYAALALPFGAAVTFQYRDARERFERFYRAGHPRLPISSGVASNRIDDVEPEAESAGARAGDYLVSINGRPFQGIGDLVVPLRYAKAGDVMVLGTRSSPLAPAEKEAAVTLAPSRSEARTSTDWIFALPQLGGGRRDRQ